MDKTRYADKVIGSPSNAVADIGDGARLAVGGFGLCGIPDALIAAVADTGAYGLEVISNNCGVDGYGLGLLLAAGRIRRIIASYVGKTKNLPASIWPVSSRSNSHHKALWPSVCAPAVRASLHSSPRRASAPR